MSTMMNVERAKHLVKLAWEKMCEHDGIEPNSKFVVFGDNNPFQAEYHQAWIAYLVECEIYTHPLSTVSDVIDAMSNVKFVKDNNYSFREVRDYQQMAKRKADRLRNRVLRLAMANLGTDRNAQAYLSQASTKVLR